MRTTPIRRLALCTAALALLSTASIAQPPKFDRLVSFGASLTDTGNAFTWLGEHPACGVSLNVPPYDALDPMKVPDGPYATGGHHFTNGATWLEGLARHLGLAGNARPALKNPGQKASNYAVGGARAIPGYPCRVNLNDQLTAFVADYPLGVTPRTLVAIEIGGNDVRDALVAVATTGDPNAAGSYIVGALSSLGGTIGQLYAYGARHFVVMNVPDVGKTPAVRSLGDAAVAGAAALSAAYNGNLVQLRDYLMYAALPGSDIRILDAYGKLNHIVANAADYGLSNVTSACVTPGVPPFKCQKPDTYLFWDGIHPTKAVHEILAREALTVVTAP